MRIPVIDCLQYANYTPEIFAELREGGVDAIHVTVAYHESFREMVLNLERWNGWFEHYPDLIFKGITAEDVDRAVESSRTAVFFGFQNPSPIEDDIGLVEICHQLGIRFMQLSYNNQSLLATGCYEANDPGLTRMGRAVIAEMNRVGMVIDMSHSADSSTLEAIECSERPIAITHANPAWWHPAARNKSDTVLKALASSNGMLGFSLYPHHLAGGSSCQLSTFCEMVAEAAERYGVETLGIGSDLCQGQPDSVVAWMRQGRWMKTPDSNATDQTQPVFPDMPEWFTGNLDFPKLREGFRAVGFVKDEVDALMGGNWYRFFKGGFSGL